MGRSLMLQPTRSRAPMFTFALPDELFKFQYDRPAFDLLFQFPPT